MRSTSVEDYRATMVCAEGFENAAHLPFPESRALAKQIREMGIVVGQTIVGREGDAEGKWWSESRLTLLWVGETDAVFRLSRRNNSLPAWRDDGEASNWTLDSRKWFLLSSAKLSHTPSAKGNNMERIVTAEEYLASPEAKRREKEEPPYVAIRAESPLEEREVQRVAAAVASGSPLPPTPETDAEAAMIKGVPVKMGANGIMFMKAECVPAWLARKLERSRDEALTALKRIISASSLDEAHWIANTTVDANTPINFPDTANDSDHPRGGNYEQTE